MEEQLLEVQDMVFSLALRMLGSVPDAEDAAQEIMLRAWKGLPSFRGESELSTWVYRIAINYLLTERKSRFAERPLSFEFYGEDILHGELRSLPDEHQNADRALLSEELKRSCTNVLLQCLAPEDRCIFDLGTMFRVKSEIAGELLGLTAENYRQRFSRVRRKVADFLKEYCGECRCTNRLGYAVSQRRLDPALTEYVALERQSAFQGAMEELDEISLAYRAPRQSRRWLENLLHSPQLKTVMEE